MSVPFRQDIFGGSSVVYVEMAFGANLAAAPGTWAWTDVTADVMYAPGLQGTWGRADETSQTTPAGMTFSLLNTSGAYSAYTTTGAHGAFSSKATPCRVRRNLGAGIVVEHQGRTIGMTPTWDPSGKLPIVAVVSAGRLRALGQPKAPPESPLYRATSRIPNLLAYWAMEEGPTSTYSVPAVGVSNLTIAAGAPGFGTDVGPGSAGAITFDAASFTGTEVMTGTVSTSGVSPTSWRVTAAVQYLAGASSEADPLCWTTTSGDQWMIRLAAGPTAIAMNLTVTTVAGGGITQGFATPWLAADTSLHTVQLTAVQNGANLDVSFAYDDAGWHTATSMLTGYTLTAVYSVRPGVVVASGAFAVAHISVSAPSTLNPSLTSPDLAAAAIAYSGETADVRLARVAAEEGMPMTVVGTSNIPLGPQPIDIPLAIYRDAEKGDGGVLFDGFDDGLRYICRSARYNMAAAFTIDAGVNSQLAPPFEPVDDDQRTVNSFTASREGGGSVTFADTTSPLSTSMIGIFPGGDTFNLASDAFLSGIAGWRVNLGTVNGLRYPTLSTNFINAAAATNAPAWMTAIGGARPISFRVDVINVATSAVNHPAGTLMLIIEGYSIRSNLHEWFITANAVAYAPNRGLTLNSATQGRIDAANTTLNATLTTIQTGSCSMTVGSFPWTTTATFPADFPLDVMINGEQITISAIAAPAGSTQAFTISARSVNGLVTTHAVNEKVTVFQPGKVLL